MAERIFFSNDQKLYFVSKFMSTKFKRAALSGWIKLQIWKTAEILVFIWLLDQDRAGFCSYWYAQSTRSIIKRVYTKFQCIWSSLNSVFDSVLVQFWLNFLGPVFDPKISRSPTLRSCNFWLTRWIFFWSKEVVGVSVSSFPMRYSNQESYVCFCSPVSIFFLL